MVIYRVHDSCPGFDMVGPIQSAALSCGATGAGVVGVALVLGKPVSLGVTRSGTQVCVIGCQMLFGSFRETKTKHCLWGLLGPSEG